MKTSRGSGQTNGTDSQTRQETVDLKVRFWLNNFGVEQAFLDPRSRNDPPIACQSRIVASELVTAKASSNERR